MPEAVGSVGLYCLMPWSVPSIDDPLYEYASFPLGIAHGNAIRLLEPTR